VEWYSMGARLYASHLPPNVQVLGMEQIPYTSSDILSGAQAAEESPRSRARRGRVRLFMVVPIS
jgi:hypothetical protein